MSTGPDASRVGRFVPNRCRNPHRRTTAAGTALLIALAVLIWSAILALGCAVNRNLGDLSSPAEASSTRQWESAAAAEGFVPVTVIAAQQTAAVPPPPYTAAPDAFSRCALKALAGNFGPLTNWQRDAYERGLLAHHSLRADLTVYGPFDPQRYTRAKHGASGRHCSEQMAAANRLRQGTAVWISFPPHLRQVQDTGAHWNDTVARAPQFQDIFAGGRWRQGAGCDLWMDLWIPRLGWHGLYNSHYPQQITVID
jgi:hypothetical protein